MTETDDFMEEYCLPERARAELEEILERDWTDDETFWYFLREFVVECFDQEPLHPRYDANRLMFPHASENYVRNAELHWRLRGETPETALTVRHWDELSDAMKRKVDEQRATETVPAA